MRETHRVGWLYHRTRLINTEVSNNEGKYYET